MSIPPPGHAVLRLRDRLDIRAAVPLAQELMLLRGRDLKIDGSGVAQIGGLCLQILLAARATWVADGLTLAVTASSAALRDAMLLCGAGHLESNPGDTLQ